MLLLPAGPSVPKVNHRLVHPLSLHCGSESLYDSLLGALLSFFPGDSNVLSLLQPGSLSCQPVCFAVAMEVGHVTGNFGLTEQPVGLCLDNVDAELFVCTYFPIFVPQSSTFAPLAQTVLPI
jgi:hypothetical protein